MNSDLTKLALRKSFLKKRFALSDQEHKDKSFAIANNCLKLPIWHLYYHIYLPIKKGRDRHYFNFDYITRKGQTGNFA